MTRTFLVAAPLETIKLQTYRQLPLHCTVLPRFTARSHLTTLQEKVKNVADKNPPLTIIIAGQAFYGEKLEVPAFRVVKTIELEKLHWELLGALPRLLQASTRWMGYGFNPHVSLTKGTNLTWGSKHTAEELVLVKITAAGYEVVSKTALKS